VTWPAAVAALAALAAFLAALAAAPAALRRQERLAALAGRAAARAGTRALERLRRLSRRGEGRRLRLQLEATCEDVFVDLAEGLRAGESLLQALRRVQRQAPGPWRAVLAEVLSRYDGGVPLNQALAQLELHGGRPLRLFVRAVAIHARTGGNLSDVLFKLAASWREERLLEGQLQARTAEARWTAYCVAATPFLLMTYCLASAPELLRPLVAEPLGRLGLLYAACSWSLGVAVLRRLTRLS